MIVGPDRDRGGLSKADRDYLIGRTTYTAGSERNTRQRIRKRTRNGLYDFEYLNTGIEGRDVAQLIREDGSTNEKLFEAAEHAIAFLFRLCQEAPDTASYTTNERFRDLIQNGIEKGLDGEKTVLDFKLDLQYGEPHVAQAQILRSLKQGDTLTFAELREALNNEYLDDSFKFKPLDKNGLPKNVDPEDFRSHDDYVWNR